MGDCGGFWVSPRGLRWGFLWNAAVWKPRGAGLSLWGFNGSFHLRRKSDWHALLAFHFFSSRGEVCYTINHNKGREENNEIHFTVYNEWFIHTVMENILKQFRLNTTGSCWGTLFINMICASIWLPHPANNFRYAALYQALIGSTVGNLTAYFPCRQKSKSEE